MSKFGTSGFNRNLLAYTDTRLPNIPGVEGNREPTVSDIKYPLFCEWRIIKNPLNGAEGDFWKLTRFESNGDANWVKIGNSGDGPVVTLSDQSNTKVDPDVDGNIRLYSSDNTVLIANNNPNNEIDITLPSGSAIDTVTPDTGAVVTADANGNIDLLGQDTPSQNGVETFNLSADQMGVRMKSPFTIEDFAFTTATAASTRTVTVENSDNTSVTSHANRS